MVNGSEGSQSSQILYSYFWIGLYSMGPKVIARSQLLITATFGWVYVESVLR